MTTPTITPIPWATPTYIPTALPGASGIDMSFTNEQTLEGYAETAVSMFNIIPVSLRDAVQGFVVMVLVLIFLVVIVNKLREDL